jgi:hypothetical protein
LMTHADNYTNIFSQLGNKLRYLFSKLYTCTAYYNCVYNYLIIITFYYMQLQERYFNIAFLEELISEIYFTEMKIITYMYIYMGFKLLLD